MASYTKPRSLELLNFLGVLPDIFEHAVPFWDMRLYKLPGGTEPIRTWPLAPRKDASPSVPWVRHAEMSRISGVDVIIYDSSQTA